MQQTVQKPTTLAIRGVNIQGQRSILAMATTLESMRWFGPAVLDAKTCRLSTGATVNEAKGNAKMEFYRSVPGKMHNLMPEAERGIAAAKVSLLRRGVVDQGQMEAVVDWIGEAAENAVRAAAPIVGEPALVFESIAKSAGRDARLAANMFTVKYDVMYSRKDYYEHYARLKWAVWSGGSFIVEEDSYLTDNRLSCLLFACRREGPEIWTRRPRVQIPAAPMAQQLRIG